ncbi:MAG TPA: acetyl-CoA carboxylase biotin carboxyl carrier protein [Chitinophagaceae bacterium]|nr:acetyl-CoA carboxylase biotin carboxyl carrier protein [Chitinophagaceae bacterium]
MDFKQIQELIRLVNKSNIGELSIEEKGFSITIKQKLEPVQQIITAAPQMSAPVSMPAAQQQVASPQQSAPPASSGTNQESVPSNTITIKSPMIGTFYRSASPGKPSFVDVGSEIEVGKVVCIIEAMKLFNEIESEVKGRIVKILAEDASPVEYDQPLFLVEPS